MMYSQQEYDMVRRQTMQIEAEKRALLRWALIVVTLLLTLSFILTGWMYNRYSSTGSEIKEAQDQAASAKAQLQQVSRELNDKKALLERNSAVLAQQSGVIQANVPKMLNKTAREPEIAELAHAIYQQPGHIIELPSMPPNSVNLRNHRLRVDGRPHKYMLVAAMLDSKWYIYSLLVKNREDK